MGNQHDHYHDDYDHYHHDDYDHHIISYKITLGKQRITIRHHDHYVLGINIIGISCNIDMENPPY